MAQVEFGTKEALEEALLQSKYMSPAGGIFSPGRAIGRVTGKNVLESIAKFFVSESPKAKSFAEQLFPSTIRVLVKQKKPGGGFSRFVDEVKGLNPTHAAQRAEANWPGSQISILNEAIKTKK